MRGAAKARTAIEHAYIAYRGLVELPKYRAQVLSQVELKVGSRGGSFDGLHKVGFINPTLFARYPRPGETCAFAEPDKTANGGGGSRRQKCHEQT
jgi:hypothetical protein